MTSPAPVNHTYSVYARHLDAHHARIVEQPSFEAAAVAYSEDLHVAPENGGEVSIIVRDVASGHEHCFKVDLGSGETASCG
jgi:hypothetical protein